MRAPDDKGGKAATAGLPPFDCYSDEQWQQIKDIVAKLSLDADTVVVSRTLLCEALENLASRYRLLNQFGRLKSTPRKRAQELHETLAEIDNLRRRFNIFASRVANWVPEETRAAADRALRDFADELRPQLDAHAGSASPRNASKPQRRAYLIELEKIWQELASLQPPQRHKPQRKLKAAFLLACAAPTFAVDASVVKNFLDNPQ